MLSHGNRRRCAALGSPIAHSLSPVLHRAAYRHLGLDWEYTAHEVDEDGLAGFVSNLDDSWRGLSLTMPLKRVALELADVSSGFAQQVGAANTLLVEPDGALRAENTDVSGMAVVLAEKLDAPARSACVWGGGATAASTLVTLSTLHVRDVHLHVRNTGRAAATLAAAARRSLDVEVRNWLVDDVCSRTDLVVSTVPAGAADTLADDLGQSAHAGRLLFDVVYVPWPTALAQTWQKHGGAVASGLDLLVHQAVGQVRAMTGYDVPADVLYDAVS